MITTEKRAEWRRYAEPIAKGPDKFSRHLMANKMLRLLDALDAAESQLAAHAGALRAAAKEIGEFKARAEQAEADLLACQEILEREMHIKDRCIDDLAQAERERDALIKTITSCAAPLCKSCCAQCQRSTRLDAIPFTQKADVLEWAAQEARKQKDTP